MTTKKTRAKKSPPEAAKKAVARARWYLGLFNSASDGGGQIVAYVRKDGSPVPYLAAKVKSKKALFHAVYRDIRFAEARAQLLKDAAKAGVKQDA